MSLFRYSIRLLSSNNNLKIKELNNELLNKKSLLINGGKSIAITSSSPSQSELIQKRLSSSSSSSSSSILKTATKTPTLSGTLKFRNYSTLLLHKENTALIVKKIMSKNDGVLPGQQQLRRRMMSTQEITKNLHLCTAEPVTIVKDPKTLRLHKPINDKPLVVLLSWLLAKETHLSKYAKLYIDQGFDVLTITITPWQLLWPTKGTQLVAADTVKFLENNQNYNTLMLHGFSVGAYLWGECMVIMSRDTEHYNKSIINRICGQIWDSAADITEIPIGVPKAMFPKKQTMQKYIKNYMLYHLRTFHEQATQHYIRSSQMFHSTMVKTPALFLLSETDPVGAVASNERVRESWESMGVHCSWKCWNKSPHVGHFLKHRDEYIECLINHLQLLNLIKYPEQMKAKL